MSDPVSGDESRPRCIDDPSRPCHNDLGSHGPREIHDHPVSGDPIDLAMMSPFSRRIVESVQAERMEP